MLAHLTSISIPLLGEVHIDGTVLLFTLLVAVATGLVFGLLPALQVRGLRLHDTLKDANRGSSVGKGHAFGAKRAGCRGDWIGVRAASSARDC